MHTRTRIRRNLNLYLLWIGHHWGIKPSVGVSGPRPHSGRTTEQLYLNGGIHSSKEMITYCVTHVEATVSSRPWKVGIQLSVIGVSGPRPHSGRTTEQLYLNGGIQFSKEMITYCVTYIEASISIPWNDSIDYLLQLQGETMNKQTKCKKLSCFLHQWIRNKAELT